MRVFLAVFLFGFFILPSQSAAAPKGSIQIAPAVIEIILKENETEKIVEFTLFNNSKSEVSIELFPVKFRQVGDYGKIGFEGLGTYNFPLVSYFVPAEKIIELAPFEKKKVQATILNRDDLSPGGHYVALIAKLIPNESESIGSELSPALSSLVLIRKTGGERFNLSLKDTNFPRGIMDFLYPKKINLLFQNEGNVHLVPYGRIDIKDIFGRTTYKGIINTGSLSVMPSARRYIGVDIERLRFSFPIMLNTVEVTGRDSLDKTRFIFRESYIYINPWLLLLVPIGFAILRLRRKSVKSKKAKVSKG